MEKHLLDPFIPENIRVLMLGSFPPKKEKWTMEFYYPNFQNDMWRIFGQVFFENVNYFLDISEKKFDKEKIILFLSQNRIGIGDVAQEVIRLKENASDKFLEITKIIDFELILDNYPACNTLISTGEKSASVVQDFFNIAIIPKIGDSIEFEWKNKCYKFYRVPSSSRAYPKSIQEKSKIYKKVFQEILSSKKPLI